MSFSFTVATYNIHKGVSAFGTRARIIALKDRIHELNPEILFLQEVQGRNNIYRLRHTMWPVEEQHNFLAGNHYHGVYGMNAIYEHGHHGNALLSRFPIIESENYDVSAHRFEERGILRGIINTPRGEIHCYVVHLGLLAFGRRRQNRVLIEMIRAFSPPSVPLIIAGDFNDWRDGLSNILKSTLSVSEVFDTIPSKEHPRKFFGKKISSVARTFPAVYPMLCLDRMYVRGLSVESAEVLYGLQWAKLSDHAPIVARLRWT